MKNNGQVYFYAFDALRAIAALAVLIHHLEQSIWILNVPGQVIFKTYPPLLSLGFQGVSFFFVLSGFLITYGLFEEHKQTGKVAIKKFYARRFLRILPLYLVIMVLAFGQFAEFFTFFGGPVAKYVTDGIQARNDHYSELLTMFLLFVPNLALVSYPALLFGSQAWSIGVEEQFYLVWPWAMRSRRMPREYLLMSIIGIKIIGMYLFNYWLQGHPSEQLALLYRLFDTFEIESLAVGALGAVYYHKHEAWFRKHFRKLAPFAPVLTLLTLLFGYLLFWNVPFPVARFVSSVIFVSALIMFQIKPIQFLETKIFRWLGRISYGTYMYHFIVIWLMLGLLQENYKSPYFRPLLYLGTLGVTYAISTFSYACFERPFLRMKGKWSANNPETTTFQQKEINI